MTVAGVLMYVLTQLSPQPTELLAAAVVLLTVALAARLAAGLPAAVHRPAGALDTSLRERARRTGVPPQRDPDARGRRRPRAPSAHPSAA